MKVLTKKHTQKINEVSGKIAGWTLFIVTFVTIIVMAIISAKSGTQSTDTDNPVALIAFIAACVAFYYIVKGFVKGALYIIACHYVAKSK